MNNKSDSLSNAELAGSILANLFMFLFQALVVSLASSLIGHGFPDLTYSEAVGALAIVRIAL